MTLNANRTTVVTGAAQGIGAAIASALIDRGDNVVAVDRNEAALGSLPGTSGLPDERVELVCADVASPEDWDSIVAAAHARFGPVSGLVNNAAISPIAVDRVGPNVDSPLEEWNKVIAVNLTGPYIGINAVLPDMKELGWGRIVNMSSTAGRRGNRKGGIHYGASKAGVLGLTRGYAYELGEFGITVNAIAPGRIRTPMTAKLTDEVNREVFAVQPIQRFGQPGDIASTVRFLTSEEAGFITGATVDVNGGTYMA